MEQYTYIEADKAKTKRCIQPWGDNENFGDFTMCEGEGCMAWVHELDDTGKPTGRGRCGMVFPLWRY